MTKHQRHIRIVHQVYQDLARVTVDPYWKSFFVNLSVDNGGKGGVRVTTDKIDGTKTLVSISATTAVKHNNHTLRLEIPSEATNDEFKRYSDDIISFMERYSTLYSGMKTKQKIEEIMQDADAKLNIRRKMDRTLLFIDYIGKALGKDPKQLPRSVFNRLFKGMMGLQNIKNKNITYDENGMIENIDNIELKENGEIIILDEQKQKEEVLHDRKKVGFYIEKLFSQMDRECRNLN